VAVTAKRLEFEVTVARSGAPEADGSQLELPAGWTAEHLLMAALVRCSITSLRYHARRAGITTEAGGRARGLVTKRDDDGRYAFVEAEITIDAELDPEPDAPDTSALLAKAERDCFISASLRIGPTYHWRVNGRDVDPAGVTSSP
jgi:organic hydroperoxide reductase OsmC/OhrA